MKWRAPSERIRTASEIPIEVDLTDADAIPVYMKISEKVLHLRRLGMSYASIADRLGVNLWMAKKAARLGNIEEKILAASNEYSVKSEHQPDSAVHQSCVYILFSSRRCRVVG